MVKSKSTESNTMEAMAAPGTPPGSYRINKLPMCSHSLETPGEFSLSCLRLGSSRSARFPQGSTSHANVDRRRTDIPFKSRVMSKDKKIPRDPRVLRRGYGRCARQTQQRKTPTHQRFSTSSTCLCFLVRLFGLFLFDSTGSHH